MNVNIRYINQERKEFYYVRMISVYPHDEGNANPEIVLHYSTMESQVNIDLAGIESITIMETKEK